LLGALQSAGLSHFALLIVTYDVQPVFSNHEGHACGV
jgi:hypothetical protein